MARALGYGWVGGAIAWALGVPLAWMIGAMLATLVAAIAGQRPAVPDSLRAAMVMVLGIVLGSAFSPDLVGQLGHWLASLAGLAVFALVTTLAGRWYLARAHRCDPVTAFFTAAPGGLNEMVTVGARRGGDERFIALSHGIRVMIVVLAMPLAFLALPDWGGPGPRPPLGPDLATIPLADGLLLAAAGLGAWPAARLHLPAAALTGPMIVSALLHLSGLVTVGPPGLVVAAAQLVVGAALGCRFTGVGLGELARIARAAALLTVLMLALTLVMAAIMHGLTGLPLDALVLAYAPGGLAEMALVAISLQVDAAFVSTHHIIRILMIVLIWPTLFDLIARR